MAGSQQHYRENVIPQMVQEQKYKNVWQVPRLKKIVLNMGLGSAATKDRTVIDQATEHMGVISGQKPIVTKAKKSIAGFKIRQGNPVGCKVTLHGKRMYEFFDRLVNVAIPRIRDFRGLESKFDGRGNYTMGLQEIIIFPEVDLDKVTQQQGMHISIITSANTDQEGLSLLLLLGMPFKRK